MTQNEFMSSIFSEMVNRLIAQALQNQKAGWQLLPQDQQEAQDKILDAIHDLAETKAKIKPEYQPQVFDAMILKAAAEMGWLHGGNHT